MTKTHVEVITSVQRRVAGRAPRRNGSSRRRSSLARLLLRWLARPGFHVSQLFRWRQDLCGRARAAPAFAPVVVLPGAGARPCCRPCREPSRSSLRPALGCDRGTCDASIVRAMITGAGEGRAARSSTPRPPRLRSKSIHHLHQAHPGRQWALTTEMCFGFQY